MIAPVDTKKHEAQDVTQKDGDQRTQRFECLALRDAQFQNHDGDDDRQHAIAERLEPALAHALP
jgi:hypothetical protein